jgi:hypothetical protein
MTNYNYLKKMGGLVLFSSLLISISGCATTGSSSTKIVVPTPLEERPVDREPVDNMDGRLTKAVIRIKQPLAPNKSTKQNLLKRLNQALDRELGKMGYLISSPLKQMVQDEIELAEIYGKESSREDADAVIFLVLDSISSETLATPKKPLLWGDPYISCEYQSSLKGWIRANAIPSMAKIGQWDIDESSSDSFKESSQGGCKQKFTGKLNELNSKLIDRAACNVRADIAHTLAPTGYVIASEQREESTLLKLSLGSSMGVKPDDKLRLYHEITGHYYGEVTVSGINLTATHAYGHVSQLNENETIYKGDIVRPFGSKMDILINKTKCLF